MTDVNGVPPYVPPTNDGPPPYVAPTGAGGYPPAAAPGRTLGIVALVLAILFNIVGGIVGIVALVQSRKAGQKNGFALAAIIVGFLTFILWIVGIIVASVFIVGVASDLNSACDGLPTGTAVTVQGQPVTCP
ncbi:DUF4190 domain-containing protein [Glaciihabitans sp. dw_435]|uniref:DUF4190 domain-containing protein n=1 Tax=Glaciihabitans sp. dw_435 TaxID=2720081 RepID=UPI001BD27780|nr:DUF4190 domain-containing protein [Glaciihabitans sp. dw_435]